MEKELHIRTPDYKIIDGILYGSVNRPLILIVHGLCSSINEALHYNAARYFLKKGFSSFRFNLYSWNKNNRKFHECTLKIHGRDIDTVANYLRRKGAKKIFAAGHSYGFPSILNSSGNFDAIASWDGSFLPRDRFSKLKKSLKPKGRLIDEGYLALMGEAMVREEPKTDSIKLLKKFNLPTGFICAGKGILMDKNKKMFEALQSPKYFKVIKGATHNFTEDGKQQLLYQATADWFKKFV